MNRTRAERIASEVRALGYEATMHIAKTGSVYVELPPELAHHPVRCSNHGGPTWRPTSDDVFSDNDAERVVCILKNGGYAKMNKMIDDTRAKAQMRAEASFPKGTPARRNHIEAKVAAAWHQAREEFMGRPFTI